MAWFTLFDQEEVLEDYIASDRREQAEKNAQITAKKLYSNKVSVDVIAQSLGYSVKVIEEWLSLVPQV
ncbi:MAG: hypothetical protein LIO96_09905 [Lachnospiraceae bacterium]|nr:hypothetical protein [Lachnospiraceae bacterium]